MPLHYPPFNWEGLGIYKREQEFPPGYPEELRTFFSPRDKVHGLLVTLLKSAKQSIVLSMFGYDDEELDTVIRSKLEDEHVYVQASLDLSQSKGVHEAQILAHWKNQEAANSIAVGRSEAGAISHLKILIVDGIYTVSGSTNWSVSGETLQDNELTISNSAIRAAEFRAVADRIHDAMLQQMKKIRPLPKVSGLTIDTF